MAKRVKKNKKSFRTFLYYECIGLCFLLIGILGVAKLGIVGKAVHMAAAFFSGNWTIIPLLFLVYIGGFIVIKQQFPLFFTKRMIGFYMIFTAILMFTHIGLYDQKISLESYTSPSILINTWESFYLGVKDSTLVIDYGGGMIGAIFYAAFYILFDAIGTKIVCLFMVILGIALVLNQPIKDTIEKLLLPVIRLFQKVLQWGKEDVHDVKKKTRGFVEEVKQKGASARSHVKSTKGLPSAAIEETELESTQLTFNIIDTTDSSKEAPHATAEAVEPAPTVRQKKHEADKLEKTDSGYKMTFENTPMLSEENDVPFHESISQKPYILPTLDLLKDIHTKLGREKSNDLKQFATEKAKILDRTFKNFKVGATVTDVYVGPAVTKFEVNPHEGVKVSKIVGLSDDIALALAAKDIRIEAPIPGKSAIGIEVPNGEISMVSIREVLEDKKSIESDAKLFFALGRDISGKVITAQLEKMPHLLVAGSTGSGKSVCINGIIISILIHAKPDEVKLMMVDPKMVELNVYNGIPHLLTPVVTDPKKAAVALKKVVSEMERRYELFSHVGVRNMDGYNEQVIASGELEKKMPYIVVIVDELADLMMVASSDVEDCIMRLSQMARAAGIHMIIATQRPSVDVITGVIKANIPSRIAFAVSSQVDSRTILDTGGAEKLLGRGDMLYLPVGLNKPIRIQGAYISDAEVEHVVSFVRDQQRAEYSPDLMDMSGMSEEEVSAVDYDEHFAEAIALVIQLQAASTSMLQRRFRVGYSRAARIIDTMESIGVIGPYENGKPRKILWTEYDLEQFSKQA